MLFAQIPEKLRKLILAELRIDFKVVSVSLKDAPTEETRYSKLAVVRDYVRHDLAVGTVDEPEEYFEGSLDMRWGEYLHQVGMVYFGGYTDRTVLGLGGSMAYVVGAPGDSPTHASSASPLSTRR